jgi:hypothetical protein
MTCPAARAVVGEAAPQRVTDGLADVERIVGAPSSVGEAWGERACRVEVRADGGEVRANLVARAVP